jgi:ribonuclease Z
VVEHARPGTAFGYRVDYGEYSVAVSGDTRFSENLIEFSEGVDVLVHEAMVAGHPAIRGHTSFTEAGEVFSRVNPRLAVFYHATSMTPDSIERTRERFSGRVVDGTDMMTIQVGESIDVYPYVP